MTDLLLDYPTRHNLQRIAGALEGLLALLTARLPAAAAAPADAVETDPDLDDLFGDPPVRPLSVNRIRWSRYDARSRELARLRTDAKHRARDAKNADQRDLALAEYRRAKSEASRRQTALRSLWAADLIDIIQGQLHVFVPNGAPVVWRSEFLQAPDYGLTLPK